MSGEQREDATDAVEAETISAWAAIGKDGTVTALVILHNAVVRSYKVAPGTALIQAIKSAAIRNDLPEEAHIALTVLRYDGTAKEFHEAVLSAIEAGDVAMALAELGVDIDRITPGGTA